MTTKKFKIVVLGDVSVGKTTLIHRYKTNYFKEKTRETLGCDCFTETEITEQGTAKLYIWDTAGSEKYQSITDHYYRKADAAIICVDLRCEESYERLNHWINEISIREEST
ncbi:hypothetical protein B4U80_09748 [Leptotrombidium deliense]|uniref:Ras-related protein Rab-24-like protein n=1 Tax=Leptotrombidium deliense TaxID=299467 RepID=A0A443RUH7_9ACAR|nr:hypothetical protein B4U80_09748 [Leptotrombidium deliense]